MKVECNKFAFFGASVTKQKDSYANLLMREIKKEYQKFGYGSMHLTDAGICFIDEVVRYKPDVCFLDWFSTAMIDYRYGTSLETYLDCLIYKLLKAGIRPIGLLFPALEESRERTEMRLEFYNQVTRYFHSYNLEIINLYESLSRNNAVNIKKILRDFVHTTEYGSRWYALEILRALSSRILELPDEPIHSNYNLVYPHSNKYVDVKRTDLNVRIIDFIEIEIENELIGIYQTIGSHSDTVEIYKEKELLGTQKVWDKWCYYERETFKISIDKPGRYKIVVPRNIESKNLQIKTLFHIGELNVCDYL